MPRLLSSILAALVLCVPLSAGADDGEVRARLTFRGAGLQNGNPDPETENTYYFETGITAEHKWFFLDANTPMVLVLVDGILALGSYIIGAGGDFPVFSALNPGEANGGREPGWLTIFDLSGGVNFFDVGPLRAGTGLAFEWAWVYPYFDDERINITPADLSALFRLQLATEPVAAHLGLTAGHSWHKYGGFNPVFGVLLGADIQVHQRLYVHLSGRAQVRRLDFSRYEPPFISALLPEQVRGVDWLAGWAFEFGPAFRF